MYRFWVVIMLAAPALAGGPVYELRGRLMPEGPASGHPASGHPAAVSLFGQTTPFQAQTETDPEGRFRFRNLLAATYTVAVYVPGRGEARETAEIGPGTADSRRRVNLSLRFQDSDFVFNDAIRRRYSVSTSQLAIPPAALRDYQEAAKDLGRHDAESAVKRLEHAVELAPQFVDAWNDLGTIAYQAGEYNRAEQCFRTALDQDPSAYEPLVNLGGVLVTLQKVADALMYNQDAVLLRPNDALANSQLGMAYFQANNYDLAVKYLEIARQIDPSHFSHPQLVLAEIHLRRGEKGAAADVLEEFLKYHPDFPTAAKMRENIARLRN